MIGNVRKVLVTGATGLVGSWLCRRLLKEGAQVTALVRDWDPQSEFIRSGDIRRCTVVSGCLEDYPTLVRALVDNEVDTVIHLGAQAIVGTALRNPLATFEANVRGTYNLLEACRVHQDQVTRVVVASSDKAYGDSLVLPYTEDMPANGRHPYDVSKSCADLLAQSYASTYGLNVTVARCGNIYGGGDLNWSRIVPGTIRSVLAGRAPILRSDGTCLRDYLHVDDAVEAYLLLADSADREGVRKEPFNFSHQAPLSVIGMIREILKIMGSELEPVVLGAVRSEIGNQYLDATKARRVLAWQPKIGLEDGLTRTIHWYRDFLVHS